MRPVDPTLYKHIKYGFVQFNRKTGQHPKTFNNLYWVIQSTVIKYTWKYKYKSKGIGKDSDFF